MKRMERRRGGIKEKEGRRGIKKLDEGVRVNIMYRINESIMC